MNNELLDTYQLKSLDGVLETHVEDISIVKRGNKYHVIRKGNVGDDNYSLRDPYDQVIRCLGWQFDKTLFHK